jgi:hypothetical protein
MSGIMSGVNPKDAGESMPGDGRGMSAIMSDIALAKSEVCEGLPGVAAQKNIEVIKKKTVKREVAAHK